MKRYIDITVPLELGMPVWPGSRGYRRQVSSSLAAGDQSEVSEISLDVHTGTHVDAPAHFIPGGTTIEMVSLDVLVGPAYVAGVADSRTIGPQQLEALDLPDDVERLLLRTSNSDLLRHSQEFDEDLPPCPLLGQRGSSSVG